MDNLVSLVFLVITFLVILDLIKYHRRQQSELRDIRLATKEIEDRHRRLEEMIAATSSLVSI